MRRPAIGICAAFDRARWAVWDVEANVSQRTYSRAVVRAGALPLVLPAHDELTAEPEQVLDRLDGLILTGGTDVDPTLYGATADPTTNGVTPERDRFELALARGALERDLPLLGICRGMQMLNIALGGSLEQNLPTAERHMHTPGVFSDHEIRITPGTRAARAAGAERLDVRSHHHQGVARLGEGLEVTARSVPDEVIEGIELPDRRFVLGILWHTEEEAHSAIVAALVEAAGAGVAA